MHNGPLNEVINFGIPGFIFQAKVTKFGANVGLYMLINISSGFYHIHIERLQKARSRIFDIRYLT